MISPAADRWARVKELFHAALERPVEDRSALLAAACGDPDLRAEVERLLAAHREAGEFIEQPYVDRRLETALVGRRIGRYEVERLIGVGGMGEVYAARDVELGREVALKIGSDTALEAQARLRSEAQHASHLNHPHICTIHEVGVFDGQPYIVMEYVAGERLSDVIPGGGLDLERTLRYGIQIADGLAHAHQHGVSHRDLKSENVVITPEGRGKILDFGLAERLAPQRLRELSDSRATFSGPPERVMAGTLSSMAPELLRGEQADERSDIWSFGVLIYEMAAGRRPFTGATGFELCGAILHQPPPPIPAGVPLSLQGVIRRCLAKDPRERYQHAGDVRSALEAIQSARLKRRTPEIRLPSRRAALAALGSTLIIAGAATWRVTRSGETSLAIGRSGRPAIAVMSFENVAGDEDIAWMSRGVPNMLLTGLAQTRGLDLVSGQHLLDVARQTGRGSLEGLDRSEIVDIARRAGAGAVVVGSIAKAGAEIRIDAQLEDLASGRVLAADSVRGTDPFALVDQLAAGIRDGIGFHDTGTVRQLTDVSTASLDAYRFYSEGLTAYNNTRTQDARDLFEKAVTIDPTFAEAHLYLSFASANLGMTGDAEIYAARAAERADRLSERKRLLLEAKLAWNAGDHEAARRAADEAIAKYPDTEEAYLLSCGLHKPLTGMGHDPEGYLRAARAGAAALPSSTLLRNSYGYALLAVGRYREAIRVFESYAELAPREPNPHDSLGEAHIVMGAPEKAIEHFSRALTIQPSFFPSHVGRAWALSILGRYDEALAERPALQSLRGFMFARVGRYREAQQLIAFDIDQAEANKNIVDQGMLHLVLSVLALEVRRPALALEHVSRAERLFGELPAARRRMYSLLAHTTAGLAAVQAGDVNAARRRLTAQRRLLDRGATPEYWWHKLLEGEIALVDGEPQKAAASFADGEPRRKMWLHLSTAHVSLLANNLLFRDGAARAAWTRGDLAGAIEIYRRLLAVGPNQKWTAMYEPRYVLEIARLLEQSGDRSAALREYERFLTFWKGADAELPELGEARDAAARLRPQVARDAAGPGPGD